MEDISRELEREIALAKPKPHKQDKKARVLIVNDFGEMKSGQYLKTFVKILSVLSIVFFVAAVIFYFLYTDLSKVANSVKERLAVAEKKVGQLTQDKEVLMARLVISGKEAGIEKTSKVKEKPIRSKIDEKKPAVMKKAEIVQSPLKTEKDDKSTRPVIKRPSTPEQKDIRKKQELNTTPEPSTPIVKSELKKSVKKTISIEKFTVTKDGNNGDLLVRFDIRNISTDPGDVSGRIFTVLKPDNNVEKQWLVVPGSDLKNGIPSQYKKGQYFSIAHFKPVKFRIKNQVNSELFKKAAIFIFNEQADLIFEKLIDITEAEKVK